MYNRQPALYIMANRPNGTLYTGVTGDLIQRVYQHKEGIAAGSRKKKIALIEGVNPAWCDLYGTLL